MRLCVCLQGFKFEGCFLVSLMDMCFWRPNVASVWLRPNVVSVWFLLDFKQLALQEKEV